MKRILAFILTAAMGLFVMAGCGGETDEEAAPQLEGKSLMVYCGAGMTEPFQEISDAFSEETGCEMNVVFANAAQIQTQINTSREGDLFVAGSADELKPVESTVSESVDLVKHIPVIAVQKDNPKGITSVEDLAGEDVTVIIGDPESTPIGKIAQKVFSDAGIQGSVNLAATTTTAPQLTTALEAGEADAAIVWKENVKGDVEIADIEAMENYIKTIPAASLSTTADADTLQAFLDYLQTEKAQDIWISYGYELAE